MTQSAGPGDVRLLRPQLSARRRHLSAAAVVSMLALLVIAGLFAAPIAFLAAGAGAGYSLSGSV